nr:MAG TPA: hypothetical protein [Bacteriophage sp.]
MILAQEKSRSNRYTSAKCLSLDGANSAKCHLFYRKGELAHGRGYN